MELKAKNIMDEVSFMEQTADIQNRLTELRTRRTKLLNADENVRLEVRTTYVPTLHTKKDIHNLVLDVEGDIYTIQQFRNKNVLDPALEEVEVPNPHDLAELAREIKPYFDRVVKVKSGEFGEQII